MAEVLGIASGVAGLISLTIEVFGISYKYVHGVRDASSSVRQFLTELEALQKVLFRVDQVAKKTDERKVFGDTGSCLLSLEESKEYYELLQKIRDDLQQRQTPSSIRNRLKALTWPFSEKDTLALTNSLHRHLEIYNVALSVDNRTIGERTFEELKKINLFQQDSRDEAILEWLSPLNMYQKHRDTLSARRGTTGSWLLRDPVFQNWIDNGSLERALWCPGNPGSGKTVITSIVVDYLLNNFANDDTKVVYIYCDYKDQAAQTASNLIACLTRQIIGYPKTLPQEITNLYEDLQRQKRRPSFDELNRLLIAMCNKYKQTYVIVDALDECEVSHERRLLLQILESLPLKCTKLFVTSRPNNEDIVQAFGRANQIIIAAAVIDLREYVLERMNERRDFLKRLTPGLKEGIVATVSAGASGMFLLAALQMDRIFDTRTIKGIKSALESMPGELDEEYEEALARIQKQAGSDGELGMRILGWITHTQRPLSVDELRYGLAVEYSDVPDYLEEFDEDNLLSPWSLVDVCAGLVVIDSKSQVVRLVHYTTQEYLDKARMQLFKGAQVDISRACLTYLSYSIDTEVLQGKAIGDELMKSNPFLDYACHHWFSHANDVLLSEDPDLDLRFVNALARFKSSDSIRFSVNLFWFLSETPFNYFLPPWDINGEAFQYEVAARFGLEDLIGVLLDHRTGPHRNLDSSLVFASCNGHLNVVRLLLKHGAAIDATLSLNSAETLSALEGACSERDLAVAEVLIEIGADIHGRNTSRFPPIHSAAVSEHLELIDLLIEKGVNVNAKDFRGATACHVAVDHGCMESTRRLIDAGCELELRDNNGNTVLLVCIISTDAEMIDLLLDRGADACAKNKEGETLRSIFEYGLERLSYFSEHRRREMESIVRRLRQAEQQSSTTSTNDSQRSEPTFSALAISKASTF